MDARIAKLVELIFNVKELFAQPAPVEYDREDLFLPQVTRNAKRLREYILHQEPNIVEYSRLVGIMHFDGTVPADNMHKYGHEHFKEAQALFYGQPINNLLTLDWQHCTPNFELVLNKGILGILDDIQASLAVHDQEDEILFLEGLETVVRSILEWTGKCIQKAKSLADETDNPAYRQNLLKLAQALERVPGKPATSFYEAIVSISYCFAYCPDSIGLIDRYLYPYYCADIEKGVLTREQAKIDLQDLFIIIQADVSLGEEGILARGGECHFAIGGYDENGNDSFNDLSHLILEAMMELPMYKPQVSLRWTKKTPREVLRFVMDCERKDKFKRIAFVNDDFRVNTLVKNGGYSYEEAVKYSMVGCNEISFPGGLYGNAGVANLARCMENTLYGREAEIVACATFDEFYAIFKEELTKDMDELRMLADKINEIRTRDVDLVSSFIMDGCVKNAKSITQRYASAKNIGGENLMGLTTVIDSLAVIKQFVYDENVFSMQELLDALKADWQGYEDMHTLILRKAKFFGNGDPLSDGIARMLTTSLHEYFKDKTDFYGSHYMLGNVPGYNEHFAWFGKNMKATPDGRHAGDAISFGIGQSDGKDREGLSALLRSIAQYDPEGIIGGPSVTNIMLDDKLVTDDAYFEKTVSLMESYLRMGGAQFQLNYVSREDLLNAKATPDKYRSLRVRVSGFSDYFVNLREQAQDEIIKRTQPLEAQ